MTLTREALIAWVKARVSDRRMEAADSMGHSAVRYREAVHDADHFDAIAALLESEGWQPIATAPKDGHVLVGGPDWVAVCTERGNGVYYTVYPPLVGTRPTRSGGKSASPTHWRELPAPPTTEAGQP